MTQPSLSEQTLASIAENLLEIGAISFEDYVSGQCPPAPASQHQAQPTDGNAVTRLHQACQRAFRSTAPLKFEVIEQSGSRLKQCILTITKPDGVQRSYKTQPLFTKKSDAKSEVAKIAVELGALEFLTADLECAMIACDPVRKSVDTSCTEDITASGAHSPPEKTPETFIDDIEQACLEWRAGHVTPHWVAFFDAKSAHKQGCALSIGLSLHVVRIYLSDPTFDTRLEAKVACAKVALLEGVLDFIKYGNGQTRPRSPAPLIPSTLAATTPWTLQGFYESLPRPFPESFGTSDASEINAPGWLNSMVQNARGGKLMSTFFFTSDGPPGLHGCILKLDRPGEYKAFLVDARFPKRADAKAAVCLRAMSEGIGNYIRTVTSEVENKITPVMRSFSSSLAYPALASEVNRIHAGLHPYFEYDKERDAFGANLVVRLSTPDQVKRYSVPCEYRNKADAKVAVICHAAEQGVIEFARFQGAAPPDGYVSPYVLHSYNPEASGKRKQSGSADDVEHDRPAKKKRGKRRAGATSQAEGSHLTLAGDRASVQPSSDQIHGTSRSGDMGLPQSVPADGLCDPSQLGVGGGGGSGAARPVAHGYSPYHTQMYTPSYPAVSDTRPWGSSVVGSGTRGCSVQPLPDTHGGSTSRPPADITPPLESGPSRAQPGASTRLARPPAEHVELEPGEVVSSAESEFSVSSSRNEDDGTPAEKQGTDAKPDVGVENVAAESVAHMSNGKGKGRETSLVPPFTKATGEGPSTAHSASTSHVKKLIDYCAAQRCGTPSFYEAQRQDRFQVWIVIGKERYDLPTTYTTPEEGRQRVAKQVLARLCRGPSS